MVKRKEHTTTEPSIRGRATTPRKPNGQLVKGIPKPVTSGRAKGTRNRRTVLLKDAIIRAAELVGEDGKGKGELVGYLKMLAVKEKVVFARLLEKVLPLHLHVSEEGRKILLTPEEAMQRLKERGLPIPESLVALTKTAQVAQVAHAINDQREDGVSDNMDNRRERDELDDLDTAETYHLRRDGTTILEGDEDWPGSGDEE
jgi:hypothetical protein